VTSTALPPATALTADIREFPDTARPHGGCDLLERFLEYRTMSDPTAQKPGPRFCIKS